MASTLPTYLLDRPLLIVLAGPNGAGKSTFYLSKLGDLDIPFVNADVIAKESGMSAYAAAVEAETVRRHLLEDRASFVFETVLSDPVGDKVAFMREAENAGYTVVLYFIGLSTPDLSQRRVIRRVLEGGHDVPADKIFSRYSRTLENLKRAVALLKHVVVLDNSDPRAPHQKIAEFAQGTPVHLADPLPDWFAAVWREE